MKKMILLWALASLTGCASLGYYDHSLKVEVKPFPITRGQPFTAHINAPSSATSVVGNALVPLAPDMKFKKTKKKDQWVFTGTVPDAFYIHPGKFKVRVKVQEGKAIQRYTEFEMQLK